MPMFWGEIANPLFVTAATMKFRTKHPKSLLLLYTTVELPQKSERVGNCWLGVHACPIVIARHFDIQIVTWACLL